jgi:hypothetical protein
MEKLLDKDKCTDENLASITAVAGFHMRAVVLGCMWLKSNIELAPSHFERVLRLTFGESDADAIRSFVIKSIELRSLDAARAACPAAVQYLDRRSSVPPAVVLRVFQSEDGFAPLEHPAQRIILTSVFVDPTKQLENCAAEYDRLRALYQLPVVPGGMGVKRKGNATQPPTWWEQLKINKDIGMADHQYFKDDIFEIVEEDAATLEPEVVKEKRKVVRFTGNLPPTNQYALPSATNHPWIDRAYWATHNTDRTQCLVLAQDKINDDMSAAVESLNAAADAIRKEYRNLTILCIAHVVDASDLTRKQRDFRYPYLLIRSNEVAQFYTPTYEPAIIFCKDRHGKGKA